jgi:hypothetical protein
MTTSVSKAPNAPAQRAIHLAPRIPKLVAGILITATITSLGALSWDAVKYRFVAKKFGVVVPGAVFRSGQISKWMLEPTLEQNAIRAIIDLQSNDPYDEHQQAEIVAARELGIEHFRFPLRGDGTGDIERYAAAVATLIRLEREHTPVLVHCAAGAQRTGGVVAFYRLLIEQQQPQEVRHELMRYGWKPDADTALVQYLNANMLQMAESLVEQGLLAKVPNPLPQL